MGKKTKPADDAPSSPGRPTIYSDELAETICVALMMGHSLTKICTLDTMPGESTVYRWLAEKDHPFWERYTRAREIQAEHMADQILDISDDDSGDISGELKMPNAVAVQRSRLRVDSRKWIASKLLPKRYGDRIAAEVTGKDGKDLQFSLVRIGEKRTEGAGDE